MSILGALTEGIGISLFVPVLDAMSRSSGFSQIPLLGHISKAFEGVPLDVRIPLVAAIMFVVVLARGGLQYLMQFLNFWVPLKIEMRLRYMSFDSVLHMNIAVANASKVGEIQNFVYGYPVRIGVVMVQLGTLISNAAMLIIYAVLMMLMSVQLTLISLVFMATVFALQRHISSGQVRRAGSEVTESNEKLGQVIYETLNGLSLIRLCVAGPLMMERYRQAIDVLRAGQFRYAQVSSLSIPLFITASGTLVCALLFIASVTGRGDTETVALVILFLFLLQRLMGPVSTITTARNAILAHMEAMFEFKRWFEMVHRHLQKDGRLPFTGLKTGIQFDDVTFCYNAESGDVLKNVSFVIPKNKMVAIVGPSGAGKSTIMALLGRLYDPQAGRVLVDGVDLRDYQVDTWRRSLSVVSQSIFLVNDTVERNLTFGLTRPVSAAEIRRAAELAACAEFIECLPHGYQTLLGERGSRLSGGEQQRVAIARAILANPEVLILDEATSHLDSTTERAIQKSIDSFGHGRTLIVIAHRMSTIRRADQIIVVKDGMAIEEGTHEALMRARGQYWNLIEHQQLDVIATEEMLVS